MNSPVRFAICAAAAAMLAACASAPPSPAPSATAQQELRSFGAPVDRFRLSGHIDSFRSVGGNQLLIRTGANDTWLLSVDESCLNLEWAHRIGITTSIGNQVQRGFDWIEFDDRFQGQRCRITEIRPMIDVKAG